MSPRTNRTVDRAWKRAAPDAVGPNRSFGGYYRTSDRKLKGKDFRGVPLQTTEDAVVAAVRLGYKVVDGQIERGLDMARRLRGAAKRGGAEPNDVLDQAERLVTRGVLLGLEWLEGASTEPNNPLARLITAQYRLLGSLLGLDVTKTTATDSGQGRTAAPKTAAPVGRPAGEERTSPLRIKHKSKESARRAITAVRYNVTHEYTSEEPLPLVFHRTSGSDQAQIGGTLTLTPAAPPVLELELKDVRSSGAWRAVVCDAHSIQIGFIEIEL